MVMSRRLLAAALPAAVVIAALAAPAGLASAAHAATRPHKAGSRVAEPLTATAAAARAKATGKPVVIPSMTTPTRQVAAEPRGGMKVTETLLPVRTLQDGRWVPLNPALHRNVTGRLAPKASASQLSLSDGGSAPLAILQSDGRILTLTWPGGPLPAPVITGATATYPSVEPGIDLAVTATDQGAIEETLIVHSAAAAASSGLATAEQLTATGAGLTAASADGGADFTGAAGAQPLFTATAPRIWDSATAPAGTTTQVLNGTAVTAAGFPAASSVTSPGAYAHTWQGSLTVTGTTVASLPPAAALTTAGITYPVYVDPTYLGVPYAVSGTADAQQWTEIESGYPNDTGGQDGGWMRNSAPWLQVGFCDPSGLDMGGCGGIQLTRSMFEFSLPTTPPSDTVATQAAIDLDDMWQYPDCVAEPLQLYQAPAFTESTTWNSSSSEWGQSKDNSQELQQLSPKGYGYSGCEYGNDDITFSPSSLDTALGNALDGNASSIYFGLKAANESLTPCDANASGTCTDGTAVNQWRVFDSATTDGKQGNITLSFYFHYTPSAPQVTIDPGSTGCLTQAEAASAPVGNDEVDVWATGKDNDGDTALDTAATVTNSSGTVVTSGHNTAGNGTEGEPVKIARGTLAAGMYKVVATTTDSFSETSPATTCYFDFDPAAPSITVTGVPQSVAYDNPITGLTLSPNGETCTSTPDPCPAYYRYQIGDSAPQQVTANSSGTWTGQTIPVQVPGTFTFTVTGINAAGNPSLPYSSSVIVAPPSGTSPDGYYTDGQYPDLITTDPGATDHSIWLSPGTGNGQVGPPVDIGSLGAGQNPGGSGPDGPADWNGAQILHGNFGFTSDNAQDVMGYFGPAAGGTKPGEGFILPGNDNLTPLDPHSQTSAPLNPKAPGFCDTTFNPTCYVPADLVYAGNASQDQVSGSPTSTNGADLIGIYGTSTGSTPGYELVLYTGLEAGSYTSYIELSVPAMAGTTQNWQNFMIQNWQDFTLATAQMHDTDYPNGDPSNTVLLALDNQPGNTYSGDLFEAVYGGPGSSCTQAATGAPCLIGQPGTWTQVTGTPAGWATAPPQLASADVNNGTSGPGSGALEIWTIAGTAKPSVSTATPYTITGSGTASTALALEHAGSTLAYPGKASWTLSDGGPDGATPGSTVASAADSIAGTSDPITGTQGTTYDWESDNSLASTWDGIPGTTAGSLIAPAANPVPAGDTTPSLSVWFKTTAANEVLVSLYSGTTPISGSAAPGSQTTSGYNPLLYIGSDGKLNAEWWNGHASTGITSATALNDGQWHHAVLTGNGTSQSLTIDGGTPITDSGTLNVSGTYYYIGAGYLGGGWPDETYYQENGNNGYLTYFNGQLADITFTS